MLVIRRLAAAILSVLVLVIVGSRPAAQNPPAEPLRLLTTTGSRPLPTLLLKDVEMIALDELATTFQVVVRDDTLARAVTVTARGKTIVLTPDQSIASVAGRLVSLPAAPARDRRTVARTRSSSSRGRLRSSRTPGSISARGRDC